MNCNSYITLEQGKAEMREMVMMPEQMVHHLEQAQRAKDQSEFKAGLIKTAEWARSLAGHCHALVNQVIDPVIVKTCNRLGSNQRTAVLDLIGRDYPHRRDTETMKALQKLGIVECGTARGYEHNWNLTDPFGKQLARYGNDREEG